MKRFKLLGVGILVALVNGCADKVPAKIEVSQPAVINDQSPVNLGALVKNKGGETLGEIPLSYSADPAGILTVSAEGSVVCIRAGKSTVKIVGGNLSAGVEVTCGVVDKTAAKISFSQPPTIVDKNPVSLFAVVLNKFDERLDELPIAYSVNPGGIMDVSQRGEITCIKAGDASIQMMSGSLVVSAAVSCRIVASVDAPDRMDFTLGREIPPYMAKALDADGRPLDSAISITSSDVSVVRVEGNNVVPVGVGTADLTATAGGVTATTKVFVSKLISSVPISIPDGGRKLISLQQGKYLVDVQVGEAGGGSHGVRLTWVGANCPNQPERQRHSQRCEVSATASLTLENPALIGFGSSVDGFLNITQIP